MTLCYFWLIVFPGFQIYSILYTIYIPKQEIPENYLANRKTKNNTQLQEEWIRRKYVVPVNIMESENNLIVENAIGGKNYGNYIHLYSITLVKGCKRILY